jgi:hypothetical protein
MSHLIEEPVDIAVVDYGMGNRRSVLANFAQICIAAHEPSAAGAQARL